MLDLANQTLNQVSLTVPPSIVLTQDVGALMRWNNRLNPAIQQVGDEMSRRVASISNHALKIKALQQVLCWSDVMALPCGEAGTQGVPQAIDLSHGFWWYIFRR